MFDKEQFIKEWNAKHPYDKWWRQKYDIPFGSQKHREASFIFMAIEYSEDLYFLKLKEESFDKEDKEMSEFMNKSEDNKNVIKMNKKEIDKEFDDIDLENFNDQTNSGDGR